MAYSQRDGSERSLIRRLRGCLCECMQWLDHLLSTSERDTDTPCSTNYDQPSLFCQRSDMLASICEIHKLAVDPEDMNSLIEEVIGPPLELTTVRILQTNDKILEEVFCHPSLTNYFYPCKWLNVYMGYSADKVLSLLLDDIAPPTSCELYGGISIEDKGELLYDTLKGRKYLIVLSIRNFEVWDAIQRYFPNDKVGSRILLSGVFGVESSRKSLLVKQEDVVVGIDDGMNKIIDYLTLPPLGLSAVTITGMGGIGKTTLAKGVFHHPRIVHHFPRHAWVNGVYSTHDQVVSHLLHSIDPSSHEIQQQDKGEILRKKLKKIRYLIVMDDLSDFEAWHAVQRYFPDDKMGSRILITTRNMEFLNTINIPRNHPPYCLEPLDKDKSWALLEKLVFDQESCPSELVDVGKKIAGRCAGLPLSVVVIAGLLCSISRSIISWRSILHGVTSILSANSEPCLDILALSYNYLPDNFQNCFLYMAAFPANCDIGVEDLLNLWIANGLLGYSKSLEFLEKEAENCLESLIGRNLIFVGNKSLDGKVKTCIIHALVRELCMRKAQMKYFMQVIESGTNAQVEAVQCHLVFNLGTLESVRLPPTLPNLRSFILRNFGSDFTTGTVLLQLLDCKSLTVLDIYFVTFDSFPPQLLNLVNLRYLALKVTYELDASISQLSRLETLLINGPWFPKEGDGIPILLLEFSEMPWLKNVYVEVPCLLKPVPDAPQSPSNLQRITMIAFSSCTEEVFALMAKVKKIGVSETKQDFENDEVTRCFLNLSILTNLETLKCVFYKGNEQARSLDLDVLPVNLKKLTLDRSCLTWDKMKFLAKLHNLETLKLKNNAFQGPEWVLTDEVFDSLKQLLIDNMDLEYWEVESTDHFPRLERLVLRSCKLEKIPNGVGEVDVLTEIELHKCTESAKNSAKEYKELGGGELPKVVITE